MKLVEISPGFYSRADMIERVLVRKTYSSLPGIPNTWELLCLMNTDDQYIFVSRHNTEEEGMTAATELVKRINEGMA